MSKWQLYGFPDIQPTNIGRAIEGLYLAYNERRTILVSSGVSDLLTMHYLEPTTSAIDRLKNALSWYRWAVYYRSTRWYTSTYGGVTYYMPEFMTARDPLASLSWINSGEAGWKADCLARYGLDWEADWTFLPTVDVVMRLYRYINDMRWRGNFRRFIYQRQYYGPDNPGAEETINGGTDSNSYATDLLQSGYYNWIIYQGQGITPAIPSGETIWTGRFAGAVGRCQYNEFPNIENYSAGNYYSWYAIDGTVNPVRGYFPPFDDMGSRNRLYFYAVMPITDCSGLYEFYDA